MDSFNNFIGFNEYKWRGGGNGKRDGIGIGPVSRGAQKESAVIAYFWERVD